MGIKRNKFGGADLLGTTPEMTPEQYLNFQMILLETRLRSIQENFRHAQAQFRSAYENFNEQAQDALNQAQDAAFEYRQAAMDFQAHLQSNLVEGGK